jgi:hypothetical protein
MSKYSQGFGGLDASMVSISRPKIIKEDKPRMPPPSRDRRRKFLSAILGIEKWAKILAIVNL